MSVLTILILISSFSFLFYGISAITASGMKTEFERYGLEKFRKLTGYLQLLGGAGLLAGLYIPIILSISAAGLSLLMLMGFGVRLKMRDGFLLSAPSFIFMLLNLYIFIRSVKAL